jgi:lipoprotein-releasing system permease protein
MMHPSYRPIAVYSGVNAKNLIARRYLFSRKKVTLISTLTLISITGVTIGTAMLIIVLSVFNGFFDLMKDMLLAYDPDIRIESAVETTFIPDGRLAEILEGNPEIMLISPYVEGKSLIAHRGGSYKVVVVRGVDTDVHTRMVDMGRNLTSGRLSLGVSDRRPGMLIGEQLANQLRVTVGDDVGLLSAQAIQRSLTQFTAPRTYNFNVRGAFSMDRVFEGSLVFIELEAAQRIFNTRSAVTGIDIKLSTHDRAAEVKQELQAALGPDFRVKTWYDLQKPLYDVMNLEKWAAYFILMLIVLVAVLNIVGSLTMIVIQKTRDIGLLMSYGFKKSDIKAVFLRQGIYVGLIGCGLGGALGLLISWLQKEYGLIKLAGAESFIISAYPVVFVWSDLLMIIGGSLLLCIVASWYPAVRASKIQPAESLRYE